MTMRKMLVLSGLLLITAFSCDRSDDSINLLAGEWTMEDSPYAFFTPTVFFSDDGRYILNSITTFEPFQTLSYITFTIKGDYVFRDGRITFNTSAVSLSDDTGGTGYPYQYIAQPGSSIGLWWSETSEGRTGDVLAPSSEPAPVEWRVLELTDHTLRVSPSPDSVMVYTR